MQCGDTLRKKNREKAGTRTREVLYQGKEQALDQGLYKPGCGDGAISFRLKAVLLSGVVVGGRHRLLRGY